MEKAHRHDNPMDYSKEEMVNYAHKIGLSGISKLSKTALLKKINSRRAELNEKEIKKSETTF
jgi:hypothetical protein